MLKLCPLGQDLVESKEKNGCTSKKVQVYCIPRDCHTGRKSLMLAAGRLTLGAPPFPGPVGEAPTRLYWPSAFE